MNHDHNHHGEGVSRRKVLECMTWAGTGVLWTIAGGVPRSLGIVGSVQAAEASASALTFLQISDSHVGFDKAANPHALATLQEAIGKIKTLPVKPSFMIHTGDITHLSKASEFDDAERIISQSRLDVHYVPGEHDLSMKRSDCIASVMAAAPRARAGIPSTPTACTSSASSTSSISRPAASATSARSNWRGSRTT
jgi:hypothetical protein